MSTALSVSELCIRRKNGPPLIGPISFDAEGGSTIGIVGETGAGKTLTLRALMGLLPSGFHMDGAVQLEDGSSPLSNEAALRSELGRKIGVVLQNPFIAFDPLKSIGARIVEGALRRRILSRHQAGKRARALLVEMGFSQADLVLKLYPNQLSGGMAQRLAIAMAVMPEPAVLLADEPTSALDATLRIDVLELLRRLTRSRGGVLVMVSHDLGLVAKFCDQLVVMYAGSVVESGPALPLLARPQHPYTQALVACTPKIGTEGKRRLASIPGSVQSLSQIAPGCRYVARCPVAIELCRREEPALEASAGSTVACHLVRQARVFSE